MSTMDLDALAAAVLAGEEHYALGECAAVEALADMLVQHARLLRVDAREYAAERMRALEAGVCDNGPFDEDDDRARADLAMAAALVWVGRIK